MSGNRTGIPQPPMFIAADHRIPFPHTNQPLRCRTEPNLFALEDIHNTGKDPRAREKALVKAKHACSGCPIVNGCLKWALANPDLTRTGVWAATTARDRKQLRKQLVTRLGDDWIGVVAEQDRRHRERQQAARVLPPTIREQALARLERESIPTRPAPYDRWKEPITPQQAASNRHVLQLVASGKAA
ncbi:MULTISPECIES: WhiB family transcriptional regulator [unclassified Streptomyces]|uniref:WhiB family transcriptional regulator n=1 Tax=unclassified Streptomyces TaxID=2593676 RepID=UPI00136FFB26|nr:MULTISPECIES: WhiB family transcriptional regulator [unclassified Streptomyces]NEA05818.1 WhiB family transcriptional regulator [Streptomyces sp. SID10116]MYY80843.1 WhiB family transcriptional regulator [Streptomyces sp. SID335]MYZ13290.1 WhiB family transcriptional regulator [Streptomyces sp. SID337]NDZ91952.1 WhiB family transcriptional regulator [Streptomyces sp. SID10115]NEB49969.1 WhiB family transcriptional regulator [Streptomyces sp. SID339]